MTETNEKKVEKESEETKKLKLDEAASIKKEKKASIKELLKEAVLHAYGFEERKNAPALSEETMKFNREVWDLTLKLLEKFEGHNDPNNNLSLFLAIKCPGMGEVAEDGSRADALGFTSGKMLNLAHLVNDVMEKHVELVGALVFDQKIRSVMRAIDPDSETRCEEMEITGKVDVVGILREFMKGKREKKKEEAKPEAKPEPETED